MKYLEKCPSKYDTSIGTWIWIKLPLSRTLYLSYIEFARLVDIWFISEVILAICLILLSLVLSISDPEYIFSFNKIIINEHNFILNNLSHITFIYCMIIRLCFHINLCLILFFLFLMIKAFEARERCGLMYMNALLFSDLLEIWLWCQWQPQTSAFYKLNVGDSIITGCMTSDDVYHLELTET